MKMKSPSDPELSGKRFRSFISYATSAIVFDVIAFSLSERLYYLLNLNMRFMFLAPYYLMDYLENSLLPSLVNMVSGDTLSFAVMILPIAAFFVGAFVNRAAMSKRGKQD